MLDAYGVWQEKSMYGRKFLGVVRATFLIGPDQRIAQVWPKVSVDGHAEEVLAAAKACEPTAEAAFTVRPLVPTTPPQFVYPRFTKITAKSVPDLLIINHNRLKSASDLGGSVNVAVDRVSVATGRKTTSIHRSIFRSTRRTTPARMLRITAAGATFRAVPEAAARERTATEHSGRAAPATLSRMPDVRSGSARSRSGSPSAPS